MSSEPVAAASARPRLLTRGRLVAAALVAAFVAVFAAVGAVSRSSPTPVTTAPASAPGSGTAPSAEWYWTMAVSPSDPSTLVLGTDTGLYRSTDGGRTWTPTGPAHVNATSVVTLGARMLMGGARALAGVGPVVRAGSGRVASGSAGVLASSSDGGKTWRLLHPRGLPGGAVQALAVDPGGPSTVDLLLTSGALYRSSDGGSSFSLVSPKLGVTPWALAIPGDGPLVAGDMDSGSHLSASLLAGDMTSGSHLRSGAAWQTSSFSDARGGRMVMEYAVEPGDDSRLLMSSYGLELSSNGGRTWQPALDSSVMFGPVAWAPSSPRVAYAVGFDGSVWRSSDGGASWTKVS